MLVKTLIINTSYEDVEIALLRLFPDENDNILSKKYLSVYLVLEDLDHISSNKIIKEQPRKRSIFPNQLICKEELSKNFNILPNFTWSECLGMTIDKPLFKKYSEEEITAIILFNIAFFGYTENANNNNIVRHNKKSKVINIDDYR